MYLYQYIDILILRIWIPFFVCRVKNVNGPSIVCFWQNFTRLISLIARIPQNCSNVLTTPNCPWPNFANILAHMSVAKATWFRIWIVYNKFLGYFSTLRVILSQHCWGNNSQGIVPPICKLSIDTHLASTSPSTFTESVGMSTTRWISATSQG